MQNVLVEFVFVLKSCHPSYTLTLQGSYTIILGSSQGTFSNMPVKWKIALNIILCIPFLCLLQYTITIVAAAIHTPPMAAINPTRTTK